MRSAMIVTLAQVSLLVMVGCGDDTASTGTGGAGGGSGGGTTTGSTTTTTGSVSTTQASTSSGQGGEDGTGGAGGAATSCVDAFEVYPSAECQTCMENVCCAEVSDCAGDADCSACLNDGDDAACDAAEELLGAVFGCLEGLCAGECNETAALSCDAPVGKAPSAGSCIVIDDDRIQCNPVTNEGCPTAEEQGPGSNLPGSSCDIIEGGDGFRCYGPPNGVELCGECPGEGDNFCGPGTTCLGQCAAYCCDDADCGTGTCSFDTLAPEVPGVGVCIE